MQISCEGHRYCISILVFVVKFAWNIQIFLWQMHMDFYMNNIYDSNDIPLQLVLSSEEQKVTFTICNVHAYNSYGIQFI